MVARADRERDFSILSLSHPDKSHTYNPFNMEIRASSRIRSPHLLTGQSRFIKACASMSFKLCLWIGSGWKARDVEELEQCLKEPSPSLKKL